MKDFSNFTVTEKQQIIDNLQTSINHQQLAISARKAKVSFDMTNDKLTKRITSLRATIAKQTNNIADLEDINDKLIESIKERDTVLTLQRKLIATYTTKLDIYQSVTMLV